MDISTLPNPYDYANPVRTAELFAGRQPELSQVAYVLAQAGLDKPVSYVAIHGQRAAGKTSVLNMVDALARDRGFVVVRLNLVPTDSSPEAFFAKLFEELVGVVQVPLAAGGQVTPRLIRRIAGGAEPDHDFPLDFPEALAQTRAGLPFSEMALREDLATLVHHAGKPIAVLVDEAQVIASSADVLSMLRTIGMQLNGLTFVLSGTTELIDRINVVFDHMLRQFEFVKIGCFTEPEDVRSCVTLPLESVGLTPSSCFEDLGSVVDDLMAVGDSNPYDIQFICHTMFVRWQHRRTERMEFSSALLDDILRTMDERRHPHEHAFIDKVKELSDDQLRALNILCSGLASATRKQAVFAHLVYGNAAMGAEALDCAQDELVRAGIIEVTGGRVHFGASLFEQVYIRLWSTHRFESPHHPQLINSMTARKLLTRQLDYILCDAYLETASVLVGGCFGCMTPEVVATCLFDIQAASADAPPDRVAAPKIAAAIARCGAQSSVDVTHATLAFGDLVAHRWVLNADGATLDNVALSAVRSAQELARSLGGELAIKRNKVSLPGWGRIERWVAGESTGNSGSRVFHVNAFWIAYRDGNFRSAMNHLRVAYEIRPDWSLANNLTYTALRLGDTDLAREWADKAERNVPYPGQLALTRYNTAMAAVLDGDVDTALVTLTAAADVLARISGSDYRCEALLIPTEGRVPQNLVERKGVNLADAIAEATAVLAAASRSAAPDPVVLGDEMLGPTSG